MAATSTQKESFTSSSSLPPRTYDVYLSFRGEDTRKNFIDHLSAALDRHGIYTFKEGDLFLRGEAISVELLKAIEGSRISVIVFSRNYANSSWCLDELVKIMECRCTLGQRVLPVFYDVDPSDVHRQTGSFAKAFARHEERYKGSGMEEKVERWRAALTEAANLQGRDLQNDANGFESKFIDKIIEDISNVLNLQNLNVADYPVGINSRVQSLTELLRLGSNDVRMVGICGIGGKGKTTIAKALYNLIRLQFEGSSFLANVRKISKQPNGLLHLQEQLLSDILMNEIRNIRNVDQGIEVIKQRLWCRRVLVVLDDVDGFEQLKALAIRRDWFHSGSRIIVTTRDESLLQLLEVDEVYTPAVLNPSESLQLFSWHVFRKDHPIENYVELSKKVVGYAGGLPLALEALGSFLFDKTIPEWKSELEKLKAITHDATQEKLRISYDEVQNLFLENEAVSKSSLHKTEIANITHEATSKSPLPMAEISDITHETTSKFSSPMIEIPNDTYGAASQSPDKKIDTSSSQYILKHPSSLVRVEISDISQLNDLPTSLHSLKIEECDALKFLSEEMMDNRPYLEQLYIISCRSLESFPSGGLPTTLKTLYICNCRKLQYPLPAKMVHQYALLERLCIESSCDSLESFSLGFFPKLRNLSIWGFVKLESISIPEELHVDLKSLDALEIRDCPKLVFFPKGGLPAPKLTSIWISNCKNLEALPEQMHILLPSLQALSISKCPNLVSFPDGGLPPNLHLLGITFCNKLTPQRGWGMHRMASLTRFEIEGECSSVEFFPEEELLPTSLTSLRISGLSNLNRLDCNKLGCLTSLETLEINCCNKLQPFPVEDLPTSLSFLIIKECSLLKIRCQREKGVDWPRKAHIPHVEIDEEVIT